MNIQKKLFEMQDLNYRDFHSKLMPNISKEQIIGIRIPALRKFAKEIFQNNEYKNFINKLPHKYYEENNLHAFLIEEIKNFDSALYETEKFLPFIDNWATCDSFLPKIFKQNKQELIPIIKKWLGSDKTYTVRYAIKLLMSLFLDEDFEDEYLALVASVNSREYYVNTMIAWYFATALAKKYDSAVVYFEKRKLPVQTHNKAIQKATESSRIGKETKKYLRSLKIK